MRGKWCRGRSTRVSKVQVLCNAMDGKPGRLLSKLSERQTCRTGTRVGILGTGRYFV